MAISQETYSALDTTFPDARGRELDLKGKHELVTHVGDRWPITIRD